MRFKFGDLNAYRHRRACIKFNWRVFKLAVYGEFIKSPNQKSRQSVPLYSNYLQVHMYKKQEGWQDEEVHKQGSVGIITDKMHPTTYFQATGFCMKMCRDASCLYTDPCLCTFSSFHLFSVKGVEFNAIVNILLVHVQSSTSTPPSPRTHRRPTSRPLRRHTSRSESHATYGTTPESSLDVTQSLTAAALGHRRTSATQEAHMKKTKSLDHQLSSEAKDYGSIEQVDYELDSRETLGVQDSIRTVDSGNGQLRGHVTAHVTESYVKAVLGESELQSVRTSGHVTAHVTESYVKAVSEEPELQSVRTGGHVTEHVTLRKDSYNKAMLEKQDLLHLQERVSTGDGDEGVVGMENEDPELGMRRYRHDTELLPVCDIMVMIRTLHCLKRSTKKVIRAYL